MPTPTKETVETKTDQGTPPDPGLAFTEEFSEIDFGLDENPTPGEQETQTPTPTSTPAAKTDEEQDYEARAREMGHIPKERFKGDPDKWVDAKTFVERAETLLPINKAQLKKFEAKNKELTETVETLKQGLDDFKKYHKSDRERVRKHAYDKAMKDFAAQKRQAVEEGDVEAYDAIEQQEAEVTEEFNKPQEPDPNDKTTQAEKETSTEETQENQEQTSENMPEAVQDFLEDNKDWFGPNQEMTDFARKMEDNILKNNPQLKGGTPEVFEKIMERVKAVFPSHFENPRRNESGHVEPNTTTTTAPPGKKGFSDLPADAKAECMRLKESANFTVEEYVEQYFNESETMYFD